MSAQQIKVPDIGDFKDVPVIEIHVKPGDEVKRDDPLITLESDKAAMDVPAPESGRIAEVLIRIGDKVSQGTAIIRLAADGDAQSAEKSVAVSKLEAATEKKAEAVPSTQSNGSGPAAAAEQFPVAADFGGYHASPSVRRLARELEIDLSAIKGTGEKGRITKDDVRGFLAKGAPGGSSGIPEIPAQDFAKFGPVEDKQLTRLRRLSGPHLTRAWLNVPHVTHRDEADITELEDYRKSLDATAKPKGYRVTLLSFLLKASVVALKEFPEFNASLHPGKDKLILKRYYNVGIAVDTPDGLVVPVIKDVDRKGIIELSQELGDVSQKMRDGKIAPADIQGGTFSISSLGGIGGTSFTPIVNAPEVAILGVVKSKMQPVWDGKAFQPRLMLPLCVSYDHRVIDGAMAARFTRRLSDVVSDVRQLVL